MYLKKLSAIFIIPFFTLAIPTQPYISSVEINQETLSNTDIFLDDFESGLTLNEKYSDVSEANGACAQISGDGAGGSNSCLRAEWISGRVSAGSFMVMFGRNPYRTKYRTDEDFREVYWRFYMKLSKNWTGNPRKLTRAMIMATGGWAQGMIAHLWGEGGDNLLTLDPATGVTNNQLATTTYNDFNNLRWLGVKKGSTEIYSPEFNDIWHCVEVHVRLNSAGNSDGVFEYWLDDELEARISNLNFVGTWQDYGLNTIAFGNYWNNGAPQEQQRYLDNIRVSTEKIGLAISPTNPTIYFSAFEDSDASEQADTVHLEIGTDTTTTNSAIVWEGYSTNNIHELIVNNTNGIFINSLSGASALQNNTHYFVRIRYTNSSGEKSQWSKWKIFSTGADDESSITPHLPSPERKVGTSIKLKDVDYFSNDMYTVNGRKISFKYKNRLEKSAVNLLVTNSANNILQKQLVIK